MKVLSAEFVTSAALRLAPEGLAQGRPRSGMIGIPSDGVPQIAFAGRSNVGKSSLLNALCRTKVARTSAAPGKTRLANIYRITAEGGPGGPGRWSVYFVDLPGYGYARGGPGAALELAAAAEGYFVGARNAGLVAALLLVDARHPGMDSDIDAAQWMKGVGVPPHVVATKTDKLLRNERGGHLRAIADLFGTAALPVSATSGEGLDELWTLIAKLARNREAAPPPPNPRR